MMKSIIKVLLTQRDSGLMVQFREFKQQLKTALLSLRTSKALGDAYGYAFNPVVDRNGHDISTQSTRPTRELPASYVVQLISKNNYSFYSVPDDPAEAALLRKWIRHLRLLDSDAACGAFLLDLIKRSCDDDLRSVIAGWNIPPTGGRQLLKKLSDFSKVGVKTSRALDIKSLQALRYDPSQDITLFSAAFNSSRQKIVEYGPPMHAQGLLKILTLCHQGFKPFKSSMDALSAYATASRDVFDNHAQGILDLQTADNELSTAVDAAAAFIDPDNSGITYERNNDDQIEDLKAKVVTLTTRLAGVTGVANALNLAVKTIFEEEKKMGEAIEFATQIRLPTGDPAEHIATVVSVVAAVTGLLARAKGEVKGITLIAEELAKESYCIALSEDPTMAKDAGGHGCAK